jgi:hypothetical protein
VAARNLYREKFQEAEEDLRKKGKPLQRSIADLLEGAASRIYGCFERLGRDEDSDEGLIHEMVRLAYGFDPERTKQHLDNLKSQMGDTLISLADTVLPQK